MPRKIIGVILTLLIGSGALNAQLTAKEILQKSEDQIRGDKSFSEMKMTIVRPSWTREMQFKSWSLGTEYGLILIMGPARDKGTVYLKRKKEIWNWVPAIERTVKLPPSMMMQSWMGSDFTNDDLVRETDRIDDFTHTLTGTEMQEGVACYRIESVPGPQANVLWGKIVSWIGKDDFIQRRSEFYDEDGELINVMRFYNIREMDGRKVAGTMEMIPVLEEGQKTVIEYISLDFDPDIDESFFSIQNMKKVR